MFGLWIVKLPNQPVDHVLVIKITISSLLSVFSNTIPNYFHMFSTLGSKTKKQPKREKTEEEKTFRRRAKYFLATQLVAVLVFVSVMSGYDFSEVEVDEDDGFSYD